MAVVVPRCWPGETAVCLGGGPSLTPEDVAAVRGRARVIAVNDAYRLAPWADVCFACDATWWHHHASRMPAAGVRGVWYGSEQTKHVPGVQVIETSPTAEGLSDDPARLHAGQNSGYAAINLAVLMGATRIILLGYDMQVGRHGQQHWFGSHAWNATTSRYGGFIARYRTLPASLQRLGVTVLNASRVTALDMFPRVALADALPVTPEAVA